MLPSYEQLRAFVEIAEAGNLTLAADRLNRTQSAISVQLKKLETAIGVTLFERGARGMDLSVNGRKFLPAARRALTELERAGRLFEVPLAGRLRVGIPDDFVGELLERALAEFAARNPEVETVVASSCASRYPDLVRAGELDLAVCSGPGDVPGDFLMSEPTVWCCREGMAPDPAVPVPLALLDRSCWWPRIPVEALDAIGRSWRKAYLGASFESLISAIRSGLAIGVLPSSCIGPGLAVLGQEEGFPLLPVSNRSILIGERAPKALASAMSGAIRNAWHGSAKAV
ncbi:LysR family transcriptional regulator [Nisaea acidiphila]|uniref:LysR family transcriptional regulator n=1 Tax=Nisaea acidiphila TaxID=1862145 RepID=A0A9J7ASW2_9PROT|nr:LysR family transcriptional regulator [Nisaea acidiphila]UUX50375.1 LysR family transcriptional regulator [Nisaea acidiphila]